MAKTVLRERRIRLIYTIVGLMLAITLVWATETSLSFTQSGLWFEIAVWLLIAAFLLEPYFAGASSALVNSLSVVFFALQAGFQGPFQLWLALTIAAGLAVMLLVADYVLKDREAPQDRLPQRLARVSRLIGTAIGSWRFSLVSALLLSLVAFVPPFEGPWLVSGAITLYALATRRIEPHRLLAAIRGKPLVSEDGIEAVRIAAPSELLVTGPGLDNVKAGDLMAVAGSGRNVEGIVLATGFAQGRRAVRVFVPELRRILHTTDLLNLRFTLTTEPDTGSAFNAYRTELQSDALEAIGTVTEGTTMLDVSVELAPDGQVELGQLVWTLSGGSRIYWQVVDAQVERESWGADPRRTVVVRATQLGRWDDDTYSFQPDVGSPSPADIVFGGPTSAPHGPAPPGHHVVGTVPNSEFPVAVNMQEFTMHHAAILGTTGTGKTHLSFDLAEAMGASGIKVICVDTTGQYGRRFPPPAHAQVTLASLAAFLSGSTALAVYTPNPHNHTIDEGKWLAQTLFNWARGLPTLDPDALPRCVVIFEEAQNFVPEQFVVDDWALKAASQDTSRIIMESRKFGLGFVLVSQRTAMVTKSALSQCNTIVAFQAVDQTGLDYLEGLCGRVLARGIPTLPVQTAISMGRGMASPRPVIVRIKNAAVVIS
jgi:hypothetical protein